MMTCIKCGASKSNRVCKNCRLESNARASIERLPPTLRDRLAMAALTGMLSNASLQHQGRDDVSKAAYMFADAMLTRRILDAEFIP